MSSNVQNCDSDSEEQFFDCEQIENIPVEHTESTSIPNIAASESTVTSSIPLPPLSTNHDQASTVVDSDEHFHVADTWDPFPVMDAKSNNNDVIDGKPDNDDIIDGKPDNDDVIEQLMQTHLAPEDYENDIVTDEQAKLELEELLSEEELERMHEAALAKKAEGNGLFGLGDYNECIALYDQAIDLCPQMYKTDTAVFWSNRAAAHMKMDDFKTAIEDCTKALELSPDYHKAAFRRATCCERDEKDWEMALSDYKMVLQHEPANSRAKQAVMELPAKIEARNERMKQQMFGQMKDLGNVLLRPFGLSTDNFKLEDNGQGGYSVKMTQ